MEFASNLYRRHTTSLCCTVALHKVSTTASGARTILGHWMYTAWTLLGKAMSINECGNYQMTQNTATTRWHRIQQLPDDTEYGNYQMTQNTATTRWHRIRHLNKTRCTLDFAGHVTYRNVTDCLECFESYCWHMCCLNIVYINCLL